MARFLSVWANPVRAEQGTPLAKIAALLENGGQSVKIVCIGDSITGVYYHTGSRRAYPEILEFALKRTYPKAKVQVINAGISGNVLPQGLARLERDVLSHKPQLVTIMYGMNDLTRFSLSDFKKNLAEMSNRCRAASAEVLLCTQNSIVAGRSPKLLAEFTQAIHEVGADLKLPVANCHKAFEAVRSWTMPLADRQRLLHGPYARLRSQSENSPRAFRHRSRTSFAVGFALALMAALRQRGLTVQPAASRPDRGLTFCPSVVLISKRAERRSQVQ